ncbi:hypothetical protein [Bradyrhizobium diazoefficiens]|uniref:hypothetical protein n=1 Tax=Bradyrhizobium diazoefficiens TaxID=1355477 RepID=UPI003482BB9F
MYTGYLAPTSNRSDWTETILLEDSESGDVIDLTGCRVTLTMWDQQRCARLTADSDAGTITFPDVGYFTWDFPASTMAGLCPGAYQIGVRITRDERTVQLIIGNVNVMEGIDHQ